MSVSAVFYFYSQYLFCFNMSRDSYSYICVVDKYYQRIMGNSDMLLSSKQLSLFKVWHQAISRETCTCGFGSRCATWLQVTEKVKDALGKVSICSCVNYSFGNTGCIIKGCHVESTLSFPHFSLTFLRLWLARFCLEARERTALTHGSSMRLIRSIIQRNSSRRDITRYSSSKLVRICVCAKNKTICLLTRRVSREVFSLRFLSLNPSPHSHTDNTDS